MEKSDGYLNNITKHQNTKILPLRWIGNACSEIATSSLVKALNLEEDGHVGYRFKFHCKVWKIFNKPYKLWGTYYMVDIKEK